MKEYNVMNNFKLRKDKERTCMYLQNNKNYLSDGKTDVVKKRKKISNKICSDYKDQMLLGIKNRVLVERYKHLHPNEIKFSIKCSIDRINNNSNKLTTEIKEKNDKLKRLQKSMFKKNDVKIVNNVNTETLMSRIDIMNKKIALVFSNKLKNQEIINAAKRKLNIYDTLIKQLKIDDKVTDLSIKKKENTSTSIGFKKETENYIKCVFDEVSASEKRSIKEMKQLEQLKYKMDSLERNRKTLMNDNKLTDVEEKFYLNLPENIHMDLSSDISYSFQNPSQIILDATNNDWHKQICEYGMMYFTDPKYHTKLMNIVKKNDTDSSSLDYKIPEDVIDYTTISDVLPTKEELAVNYVLKKSGHNDIDEFSKCIERTKNDLSDLYELKRIKTTLCKSLVKRKTYMQEIKDSFNCMTNKDIEFSKQVDNFISIIDDQNKEFSECEETKNHYLWLLNNMHFSLDKVRVILKKINISADDQQDSYDHITAEDKTLGDHSLKFLEKIKFTINEIDKKIIWCNLLIPDDIDSELLNSARAIYKFKCQAYTQEEFLHRKFKSNKILTESNVNQSANVELILSRDDAKKQSKEFVINYHKQNQDNSKKKRKLISFRRSFV